MKAGLIVPAFLLCLMCACSPRIVERVWTEVQYRDRTLRDSLYVHDSIYVFQHAKNDTVYLDKYVYKYAYKDRFIHDTTYIAKHDTTIVVKEVPAKLTKAQQWRQNTYGWLLAILVALIIWCLRKPILSIVKRLTG